MNAVSNRFQLFGIGGVLALAVFFVYGPVRNHDFVSYDDAAYVTGNPEVQSGLNARSFRWAFTTGYAANWHPLTWLSHMLDCKLFGLSPRGPHVENLLFHVANTLLLFVVLRRMTGGVWPSAFVAALFGLHPLHVESVAWVAERKDVLSTFFWMLTLLAYVWYAEKPKIARYLLVLLLFALGLMAKPMLVTLPFVLLLLDYWPLQRLCLGGAGGKKATGQVPWRHLLLEKVPLMVLAAASCIATVVAQRQGGAVMKVETIALGSRLGNAVVAYIAYIGKMFWPSKLAVLYLHPGRDLSKAAIVFCGLLLIASSVFLWWAARRRRYLSVGWLWYLGTLVPVIGLVQVGMQGMADRYTYIPLIGLFIPATWGVVDLLAKWPHRKPALAILATVILVALAVKTSLQLRTWRNSVTLFEHTLAVAPDNYVMHNNYATFLMKSGRLDDAVAHFQHSVQIRPNNAETHNDLGNAYSALGKIDAAIEEYRVALSLAPGLFKAHYNLALALSKQKKTEEAVKEYYESMRLAPGSVDADTLVNLANELGRQGNFDRAIEVYKKALAIQPDNINAHRNLGLAYALAGKTDEAIAEFRLVLKARPNDVETWCNLGALLQQQGKTSDAIDCFRRAVQIDPTNARAQNLLNAVQSTEK